MRLLQPDPVKRSEEDPEPVLIVPQKNCGFLPTTSFLSTVFNSDSIVKVEDPDPVEKLT